jgi:predicted chitinase
MTENAATARALRADEYEARFLRSVEDDEFAPTPRPRREPRPRAYGTRAPGSAAGAGMPGRRTIQITGQAAPPRRRATSSTAFVARPDRTAMWAFLLALFLVLMAVATAHAAV